MRVLLHAECVLYVLVVLPLMLNYSSLLLLVVSGAALVAGLPEAAAGRWARGIHYSALLFWLFLVVMFLVYFVATLIS